MKYVPVVGTILVLLPVSLAQQSVWGQCGGNGWTGSKTCVSGSYCKYMNDWYSQCIPGTASTTVPSTTSTTTRTSTSTSSTSTSTGTAKAKYWFSFGDSYTATGFSATGNQPSASNIIGNPSYPGNSQCGNGLATWVVYAANSLDPSLSRLYNYAVSGATIDNSIVGSSIPSVSDQVKTFLNNQAPGKTYYPGWSSSGTLFSVWIGINDIGGSYSSKPLTINDTLLNRYFELMQSLYAVGARNFLFLTVPPVYKSPLMLSQSSSNRNNEKTMIDDYNKKLATKAAAFASANSGVTVQVHDTTPLFNTILSSPSTYGFRDATSSGSGTNYAWCDVYHPSPAFHNQIAKEVAALVQKTYACWSDFLYC